jgi:hypothetical protein
VGVVGVVGVVVVSVVGVVGVVVVAIVVLPKLAALINSETLINQNINTIDFIAVILLMI